MKKLFILFTAACLFSCSDTKHNNNTDDPEKPQVDKPAREIVKKPEAEQKKDLKELFDPNKADVVKSEDKSGWPEDRKNEVRSFCMDDMEGVPDADAKAFCNCQLNNLMKIFSSYEEAMNVFNNMDDDGEISDDQMNKVENAMNANESCMEQLMRKYNEGYDAEEEKDDAEESGRKKKNP